MYNVYLKLDFQFQLLSPRICSVCVCGMMRLAKYALDFSLYILKKTGRGNADDSVHPLFRILNITHTYIQTRTELRARSHVRDANIYIQF